MKTITFTASEKELLVKIAKRNYGYGLEVFETEPYDDLGHTGLETCGLATIVLKKLDTEGDVEFSDEVVNECLVHWIEWERDAAECDGLVEEEKILAALKAKVAA